MAPVLPSSIPQSLANFVSGATPIAIITASAGRCSPLERTTSPSPTSVTVFPR